MSEIELEQGDMKVHGDRQPSPRGSAGLAVLLAALAAVTTAALAYSMHGEFRLGVALGLGGLGAVGLFTLLAAVAGRVRFGKGRAKSALAADVLDQFTDACAVTDQRGRVIYANKAYNDLAREHSPRRLASIEKLYAGYPEISEPIYRLSQASLDHRPLEEEIRLRAGSAAAGARRDDITWLRVMVSPVKDKGADATLWRIADVTQERDEQETAFNKLQHIIDFLDHAPAGFFSADGEQRIQYINATLAEWLKIDLAKTTGGALKLSELVEGDIAQIMAPAQLQADEVRTDVFDVDLKTGTGDLLPVRIIHRVDADGEGRITALRSLVLNRLAGPESAKDDAEAARIRLARFINNAPIAIAEIDGQGTIENANAAFVSLFGEHASSGVRLSDLVITEILESLSNALAEAAEGLSKIAPVEIVLKDQGVLENDIQYDDGRPQRTARLFLSLIENAGDGVKLIAYAVDTTEQKSLELQFAQSQKMQAIGQLAGGVAHDFNNVLTAIIGFSDLLLARHRPTDPSFQDIMNIKQNANRAANLVRQLLAFSRRQTLRPQTLSLSDVLSDLGNLLGRLLGEHISLKTVHGRELGLVKVDLNQFEQVIINLAVNARDAMPDGGELVIRTTNISEPESKKLGYDVLPAGEYVLCDVSDTGSGMSKEVLEKVYEPFFSTKEVGKGTGLGLSTVYGIIKQTGGFIFAESELGKGTTFHLYLPRHYPDETEIEPPIEVKPETKADLTGEGTILLVEDEDAVRTFASRALASRGYTVLEAASGKSALEVLKEFDDHIDLVISDVVMPEMDGPTLLKELRKLMPDVKIVFISGYAEDAFKKNLSVNEKFTFLPKPFSLKQLASTVKDVLSDPNL